MDPWNRSPEQRIEDAREHKRLGTEKFKVWIYSDTFFIFV